MIHDFECELAWNAGLGSMLVYNAVLGYAKKDVQQRGFPFLLSGLLFGLVFHADTVKNLRSRRNPGILYKLESEYPEFRLGLKDRVSSFLDLAFASISLAAESGLVIVGETTGGLYVAKKTCPNALRPADGTIKDMAKVARSVGECLATMSIEEIVRLTGVTI